MKIVNESKYSLKQDLKYGSVSIIVVITVSFFFYLKGLFNHGYSNLNVSSEIINWGFFFIAVGGLVGHYLMVKIKSYPVLFSFSIIAVLFLFLQLVGFGNRGHLLYLSILPFFMIYYIYLIATSSLEKPSVSEQFIFDFSDISTEGSLSGSCDGEIDLGLAQTIIFSKTFLYTVFLFSLAKTVADITIY